jgi:hypothetical protein
VGGNAIPSEGLRFRDMFEHILVWAVAKSESFANLLDVSGSWVFDKLNSHEFEFGGACPCNFNDRTFVNKI